MQIKKTVSNRIYEITLIATALFVILDMIGLWVTWNTANSGSSINPFGYVTGALLLCGLIASGILAFLNERINVRKQWIVWAICFVLHLVFFILVITLTTKGSAVTIPALFTVLLICILAALAFFLLKDKIVIKRKQYTLTPTTVEDEKSDKPKAAGDVIQKTITVNVESQEDNTPKPGFTPSFENLNNKETKKEEKQEENKPTGVITL